MMIYDGLIEMREAGMNSTYLVFVNMISSLFLIHPIMNETCLASLLSMLVVVVIKRKPKNISRSSFACWEHSHVNSFVSFLFFVGREEKTMMKMLSGSHMHYC